MEEKLDTLDFALGELTLDDAVFDLITYLSHGISHTKQYMGDRFYDPYQVGDNKRCAHQSPSLNLFLESRKVANSHAFCGRLTQNVLFSRTIPQSHFSPAKLFVSRITHAFRVNPKHSNFSSIFLPE